MVSFVGSLESISMRNNHKDLSQFAEIVLICWRSEIISNKHQYNSSRNFTQQFFCLYMGDIFSSAKQQEIQMLRNSIKQMRTNIYALTRQYNEQAKQLKSLKDPSKIKENQQRLFFKFLRSLPKFDLYNEIPKVGDVKHVTVIGETSAGKSSIYNWVFNLKLKTGHAETTMSIQSVHSLPETKRSFLDCPGFNQEIEIVDPQLLKALYDISIVFIATGCTFKLCKRAIQVLNTINPPQLFMVRTKCDLFQSDQQLEQTIAKDRKYLASLGVHRQILCISTLRDDNFRDNKRFKYLMKGK